MKIWIGLFILALFISACAPTTPPPVDGLVTVIVVTSEPSTVVPETEEPALTEEPLSTPAQATSLPTLSASNLSVTELKYRILQQYPNFFYCDPDFYPVASDNELVLAKERFEQLQSNQEEFELILSRNNLSNSSFLTDQQKLLVYREYKKLNAISLQQVDETYQFQIQIGREGQQGFLITGTIDANGAIQVQKQESSFPTCPICLAAGTLVDTPRGAVAVEELRLGDPVWTMNAAGERVPGEILKLGNVNVPATHEVIHILLSDGRNLWASPGHPTADGQRLVDVQLNDLVDGARVILVERLPYDGSKTYDLLPSGETGLYWANGIPLGSTLTDQP